MQQIKQRDALDEAFPSSIGVLGATGSVGTQAVDVIRAHGIPVDFLTAHRNVALAEEQIRMLSPRVYVMTEDASARELALRVKDTSTRVYGREALENVIGESDAPTVIHSILGEAGLSPLLSCIEAGKRIGLANKESLVIAGDLFMGRAKERGATIIPVDSEHSAIFQCLDGKDPSEISALLLTASGGPFFGCTKEELARVTKKDALAHPTWKMGAKITVDSATLMNKGFEVIEAVRLFGVRPDQINVVVHRESIIHSAVEYIDSAVIAQMGVPDMRLCVQYAITYPHRRCGVTQRLSLADVGKMTFFSPDTEAFPLLPLAFSAISRGGAVPAVLNAANEVAVEAFLTEKLSFTGISAVVSETVETLASEAMSCFTLDARLSMDRRARELSSTMITSQRI